MLLDFSNFIFIFRNLLVSFTCSNFFSRSLMLKISQMKYKTQFLQKSAIFFSNTLKTLSDTYLAYFSVIQTNIQTQRKTKLKC
jgi:hypothetical protein